MRLMIRNLQPTYHRESRFQTHPEAANLSELHQLLTRLWGNSWLQHSREASLICALPFPEWKEL